MAEIHERLLAVMNDVQAVGKNDRNNQQGFNFRGIDAVINAVGPAFRKHGVFVVPSVQASEYSQVEVGKNRTPMGHCRLEVAFAFIAPDGSLVEAVVPAEAMDSGDKATAKAMSVALRTALLQVLALPTDEPDPDASSYERAPAGVDAAVFESFQQQIAAAAGVDELDAVASALKGLSLSDGQRAELAQAYLAAKANIGG
jgi:hypothetical protein